MAAAEALAVLASHEHAPLQGDEALRSLMRHSEEEGSSNGLAFERLFPPSPLARALASPPRSAAQIVRILSIELQRASATEDARGAVRVLYRALRGIAGSRASVAVHAVAAQLLDQLEL